MFIQTRVSAPKMFAKFGCQTPFVTKKRKNGQQSLGQTDYSATCEVGLLSEYTQLSFKYWLELRFDP